MISLTDVHAHRHFPGFIKSITTSQLSAPSEGSFTLEMSSMTSEICLEMYRKKFGN